MGFANSERKVLEVLSNFENLTQGEISALAKMPKRTVRFAVLRLKEKRILREFLHLDARMSSYALKGTGKNWQKQRDARMHSYAQKRQGIGAGLEEAEMHFGAHSMRRFL